jgi:hypothetical protein
MHVFGAVVYVLIHAIMVLQALLARSFQKKHLRRTDLQASGFDTDLNYTGSRNKNPGMYVIE